MSEKCNKPKNDQNDNREAEESLDNNKIYSEVEDTCLGLEEALEEATSPESREEIREIMDNFGCRKFVKY
jgi:hypothetical protein